MRSASHLGLMRWTGSSQAKVMMLCSVNTAWKRCLSSGGSKNVDYTLTCPARFSNQISSRICLDSLSLHLAFLDSSFVLSESVNSISILCGLFTSNRIYCVPQWKSENKPT